MVSKGLRMSIVHAVCIKFAMWNQALCASYRLETRGKHQDGGEYINLTEK